MKTFTLKVSSPEGDLFSGDAVMLTVRGTEGDLAVMAGHVPFVTAVKACTCKIVLEDETEKTADTDGGLLTVTGEKVILLAGRFEWKA